MEFCYKSRAEAKKMKVDHPLVQLARHQPIRAVCGDVKCVFISHDTIIEVAIYSLSNICECSSVQRSGQNVFYFFFYPLFTGQF